AGQHDRRNLLHFGGDIPGEIVFTRRDTGDQVAVSFSAQGVPGSPAAMPMLQKILSGHADETEKRDFAQLWQDRVRRILEAIAQPGLVTVSPLPRAACSAFGAPGRSLAPLVRAVVAALVFIQRVVG